LHNGNQLVDSQDCFTQSCAQEMKTVGIDDFTHKQLKSLCKTYGKSIVEFIRHGVVYFKKTGINPEESTNESPQKAIRELARRVEQIIGVIKAQQQDTMNPLLEQLMMLVSRMEMLLGDAPKETTFKIVLSRTEEMIEADQKHHLEQLTTQHKYYKEQMDALQKSYGQINEVTLEKMDEVLTGLDKMTVAMKGLNNR
jgi:prefoldin subunit 5